MNKRTKIKEGAVKQGGTTTKPTQPRPPVKPVSQVSKPGVNNKTPDNIEVDYTPKPVPKPDTENFKVSVIVNGEEVLGFTVPNLKEDAKDPVKFNRNFNHLMDGLLTAQKTVIANKVREFIK